MHIYKLTQKYKITPIWSTTLCTLYKSLVRSHLEYTCPLWNPSKISDIVTLEEVQRAFLSKVVGFQHLSYWDRLRKLGMMSLQRRRERYIIIQMWKILNQKAPNDINVQFNPPSRRGITAQVPLLNRSSSIRHQTRYDNSFAVLGPRLWNVLPPHLTLCTALSTFKNALTKFVRSFPDTPPVRGSCNVNGNSILDWNKNNAEALRRRSADLMTL